MGKENRAWRIVPILCFLLFLTAAFTLTAASNSDIRDLLYDTTVRIDNVDSYGEVYSFGTGFFFSENGLVCTNFHVIEDHFREGLSLRVKTNSGGTFDAVPLVWNYTRDWAVLQVEGYQSDQYLGLETSVELLDEIWAAGYPITGNLKITEGTVSSYQPDFMGSGENFYDVSMKFDGGNSGGPVINDDLEVIGIVVAYYTEARDMDFIIPMGEIVDELYWARQITGSTAYVPDYISGEIWEDDSYYYGDSFTITNDTGYEISYLYMLDDDMVDDDYWGPDLLGSYTLSDGDWLTVYPEDYDHIQGQVDELLGVLTILAVDYEGDMYIKEWWPDLDAWDIELTFDDHESNWGYLEEYDDDPGYEIGGMVTITNDTGYDLEAIYFVDDDMLDDGRYGDNALWYTDLYDGEYIQVDSDDYPIIGETADQTNGSLTILAYDTEGDAYIHDWYPGTDSWSVRLTFADYIW